MTTLTNKAEALLLLHFIVFVWGFTGILGQEISLPADSLVGWRVWIAAAGIGGYALIARKSLAAAPRDIVAFASVGLITALHWICFFASIKASNISTALSVLSTTSFFVALVAPVIRKSRFLAYELVLGIVVIAGLFLIFRFEPDYTSGILLSLAASFFAALFSSFNSVFVARHPPHKIAFYEMAGAAVGMTIWLVGSGSWNTSTELPATYDILLLLILGLVATAYAFIAGIRVMQVLTPFTCAITINLEPVYTILFALFLYGEREWMSTGFYLGAMLILSTLFINAWMKRRSERSAAHF
ncbi:MAG: DMT family transporter [Flavobacteriales bacterium]|jgi:drug/metabolite transporter (DMT)-like permease